MENDGCVGGVCVERDACRFGDPPLSVRAADGPGQADTTTRGIVTNPGVVDVVCDWEGWELCFYPWSHGARDCGACAWLNYDWTVVVARVAPPLGGQVLACTLEGVDDLYLSKIVHL